MSKEITLRDVYDKSRMRADYDEYCATFKPEETVTPLRMFRAGFAFGIQAALDHEKARKLILLPGERGN